MVERISRFYVFQRVIKIVLVHKIAKRGGIKSHQCTLTVPVCYPVQLVAIACRKRATTLVDVEKTPNCKCANYIFQLTNMLQASIHMQEQTSLNRYSTRALICTWQHLSVISFYNSIVSKHSWLVHSCQSSIVACLL